MQILRRVVQTTSLKGYGGIPSSGGLSAMYKELCLAIMNGLCPGQGGGAAKTHKEPPSQLLSIAKLTNFAFWSTETLYSQFIHTLYWKNLTLKLYHQSLMIEETVQMTVQNNNGV